MAVTLERIESVAPDQASLNAARKLLKPDKWPALFCNDDESLLWGECQGSGSTPYRMAVATSDLGAKCSCPSRKFPCKHSIALMWWRAESPERFSEGIPPDWIGEWLSRRRNTGDEPRKKKGGRARIAAAGSAEKEKPRSAADEARAEKRRQKSREEREQSILAGLDELDRWLTDQLERGLGAFATVATQQCRVASERLVDAKASGLASRLEALPARYFGTPEPLRHDVLLESLGTLHLIAEAYRGKERLPEPLRRELMRLVGWSTTRAELLEDSGAERVRGEWGVVAIRRESQADKLVRCETWLTATDGPRPGRWALLIDHQPVAVASSWQPPAGLGERFAAELVFQPAAAPLVAVMGERQDAQSADIGVPAAGVDLGTALEAFDAALACTPWLERWPLAFDAARVRRDPQGGLWAVQHEGADAALPIRPDDDYSETLLGVEIHTLHGIFDGHHLLPLAADTAIGPWWNEAA